MATQVAFPGTVTTEVGPSGDNDWTNPGDIGADDGSEAQITAASYDANDHSFRLRASNFGFTVPTGATIDGITVEIEQRQFAGAARDQEVRLFDETGTLVGDDKATATAWPGVATIATYGGATDDWLPAGSWTPAQVNDPDFGVAHIVAATAANTDIGVDFVRITVHYTPAPATIDAQPGSFTETGAAATLQRGFELNAQPGSFALTGVNASPLADRVIDAQSGSIALTGFDASTVLGRVLDAGLGVYVVTGANAGLIADRLISADPGAFVLTGFDAGLVAGRAVNAEPGSIVLTGFDAGLVIPAGAFMIDAAPGVFSLTGIPAELAFSGGVAPAPVRRLVRRMASRVMILGRSK